MKKLWLVEALAVAWQLCLGADSGCDMAAILEADLDMAAILNVDSGCDMAAILSADSDWSMAAI